jgi:hypothetical protein
VQWVISDFNEPSTAVLLSEQDQPLQQEEEQEEQQEEKCAAEVSLWSRELQVLLDMGFGDRSQLLLSLLQTHMRTPATTATATTTAAVGAGAVGATMLEQGLQEVVLALLSGEGD